MKYAHLDRLRDDDDEDLLRANSVSVHVRVWTGGGGYEASLPGFPGIIVFRTLEDTEPLRRTLQRHLDGLANSAAATFLEGVVRKDPRKSDYVMITLRAPGVIVSEVLKNGS